MHDRHLTLTPSRTGPAIEAYRGHHYVVAAELAPQLAAEAHARGDVDTWWDNAALEVHALSACGRFDVARDRALELTRHRDGQPPLRRAQAWTLAAQNARHEGMTEARRAVGYARNALSIVRAIGDAALVAVDNALFEDAAFDDAALAADPPPAAPDRGQVLVHEAEALVAFIGAAVACQEPELAEAEVPRLREVFDELPIGQAAALVAWVLGTMDYAQGHLRRGAAYHSVTEQHLDPRADLRTWGRFHKAAAFARLDAGLIEDVGRHLATARPVLRYVGNNEDIAELAVGEARFRIRAGDLRGALAILAEAAGAVADAPPRYRATIEQWRSATLGQLGDHIAAAEAARAAAQLYRLAGFDARADEAFAAATEQVHLAWTR